MMDAEGQSNPRPHIVDNFEDDIQRALRESMGIEAQSDAELLEAFKISMQN